MHVSPTVINFTEDFDFEAMNKKFNKEEARQPVYCKDDFFDSLSCNPLYRESGRGKVKLAEQRRLDTETFGEFQRHQLGCSIHGPGRVGRSRGSYRGRGYGHAERGRGRTVWCRVT
ncbi:unnamed protein product [Ilex paraguariensis]|uniref:Uncharacterized protein n=1 Tax=Ilex paraguariensis TaxID=185542 RepID=A0ABC8RWA1_9AQUA